MALAPHSVPSLHPELHRKHKHEQRALGLPLRLISDYGVLLRFLCLMMQFKLAKLNGLT